MKQILIFTVLALLQSCRFVHQDDLTSISILPPVKMLLMDSTTIYNTSQIPPGKPTILLYFRPTCPHCKKETNTLLNNISALKDVNIYMLASAPFVDINNYSLSYHLESVKNITVGKDLGKSFTNKFAPKAVPYMAIYDTNRKLVKIYYGEVEINSIITAVHA
jgi:thiol-disulfide isomerase/thioredoxin